MFSTASLRSLATQAIAACGRKPKPQGVAEAMASIHAAAGAMTAPGIQGGLRSFAAGPVAACRAGCKACCHQQIGITVAEAIHVARHVEALPAARRAELAAALEANAEATRGLTTSFYLAQKRPCAFLDGQGSCSIYAVRPLRCRGLQSTDASVCAALLDDYPATQRRLGEARLSQVFPESAAQPYNDALMGVLEGLAGVSRKLVVSLEFQAAVAALLRDRSLAAKWLAGARPSEDLHLRPDPA